METKTLQFRIMLWTGICLAFTAGAIIVYSYVSAKHMAESALASVSGIASNISDTMEEKAVAATKKRVVAEAQAKSFRIRARFEEAMGAAATLAQSFSGMKSEGVTVDVGRDAANSILRSVLEKNKNFFAVYTCWEPDLFDMLDLAFVRAPGHDETGRFIPYWHRGADGRIALAPARDYENTEKGETGIRKGEYYLAPKERKTPCLIDPASRFVEDKAVSVISLVVPIVSEGEFCGIAGVDLRTGFLEELVREVAGTFLMGKGRIMVISHRGILAAASEKAESSGGVARFSGKEEEIMAYVRSGKDVSEIREGKLAVFVPLTLGKTETPWTVHVSVPDTLILAEAKAVYQKMTEEIGKLGDSLSKAKGEAMGSQSAVGALLVLLALFVILFISRNIAKPIREVISGLGRSSGHVLSVSGRTLRGAQELARQISDQAISLEEMSASLDKIASVAEQNSGNAAQAEHLAGTSVAITASCADMMKKMAAAIAEVNETSQEVRKIAKLIEDIAFQTNLLALNAAVEAARAGEAGAGFAVVAGEVKNLAARSSEAARNTSGQMDGIAAKIDEAADMTSRSLEEFGKVGRNNERMSELITMIAAAFRDQSRGIGQIRESVIRLEESGQRNAVNADDAAAASQDMRAQAEKLEQFVNKLALVVKRGAKP